MDFRVARTTLVAASSLAAIPIIGVPAPASAKPYIDVSAFYDIDTPEGLPSGFTETCGGSGCDGELSVTHDFTTSIAETATLSGSATFTNTADTPYSGGFQIISEFSAFNGSSGGPEIGLSIDNASEAASFSSAVTGTLALDTHSCSLPAEPSDRGYFSTLTCGVVAPDSSEQEYDVSDLPAGGSLEFDWSIVITDSFFGVPEPSGLAILGSGLLGLFALLRSRSSRSGR